MHSFLKPPSLPTPSAAQSGKTALLWAAEKGHAEVARVLLGAGAPIEPVVHELVRNNAAAELVKETVAADPSLAFRRDGEGRTTLQVAAKECKAAIQSVIFLLVPPPVRPPVRR